MKDSLIGTASVEMAPIFVSNYPEKDDHIHILKYSVEKYRTPEEELRHKRTTQASKKKKK